MMNPRVEDMLGKLLIVLTFGYLAFVQMVNLLIRHDALAGVAVQALSLIFVLLVVVMTLKRLPATRTAVGLEPRLAAIAGTFLLMVLVWLPTGSPPVGVQAFATLLLLSGTIGSIYCLHYLGRSFSILASARELVTGGPYSVVRHPLYVAEAISTLGIIIAHWSWPGMLVGAAHFAVQWRRMQHEESVLRDAFPVYADYARRVPMLIPGGAT